MNLRKSIFSKFLTINKRSRNVIIQTVLSGFLQVVKVVSSFILISLLLDILGTENYGIWATLTSMIGWFSVFDLGLHNGLRNEVSKKRALNDLKNVRQLIGSSYWAMSGVSLILLIVGLGITYTLDFTEILKAPNSSNDELRLVVSLLVFSFAFRLTFKLVAGVVFALQKPALNKIQDSATSFFYMIVIFLLKSDTNWSLLKVATVNVLNGVLIWIAFTIFIYYSYKEVRPKLRSINFLLIKPAFTLGITFFVVQITTIINLSTDQFIINNVFGPETAASFSITTRIFQVPQMFFALINATIWSSFTEAYFQKDRKWIEKTLKVLRRLWIGQLLIIITLILLFDYILVILGASHLDVPRQLIIGMGLIQWSLIFNKIYGQFINGVGLVRKQLVYAVFSAACNIPLSYALADTPLGPLGVIGATFILQIPYFFWAPWITHKTLRNLSDT